MEHSIETLLSQLDALRTSLLNDPTNTQLQHQLTSLMKSIQDDEQNQPQFYQSSSNKLSTSPAPTPPDSASGQTGTYSAVERGGDSGAEYYDASDDLPNSSVAPPTSAENVPQLYNVNFPVSDEKVAATGEKSATTQLMSLNSPLHNTTPLSNLLDSSTKERSQSASRLDFLNNSHMSPDHCATPSLSPPPTLNVISAPSMQKRAPSPLTLTHNNQPLNATQSVPPSKPPTEPTTASLLIMPNKGKPSAKALSHEKRRYSQHARTIAGINLVSPFCDISLLETHPNHMCLFLFSAATWPNDSHFNRDYYASSTAAPLAAAATTATTDLANSLLFHLLSGIYRQQTLHTKSDSLMRRWAYELYSTFLLSSSPLELVCMQLCADDMKSSNSTARRSTTTTLLAHIDDVLAAYDSNYDNESDPNSSSNNNSNNITNSSSSPPSSLSLTSSQNLMDSVGRDQHQMLRDIFSEARLRAAEHVRTGLNEFNKQQTVTTTSDVPFLQGQCRQLAQLARLNEDYVLDHILSPEHIAGGGGGSSGNSSHQRSTSIFERFLAVQLDNLTFKQPPATTRAAIDVRKALGSCYATLAKCMFDRKSLPSLVKDGVNLIEQWPPVFMKEKSKLMNKIITTMKKPAVSINGHQFQPEALHVAAFCDLCQQLIWGVAPQGYQCQLCQVNVHKICVNKDLAGGSAAVAVVIEKCISSAAAISAFGSALNTPNGSSKKRVNLLTDLATKFPRAASNSSDRVAPKTAAVMEKSVQPPSFFALQEQRRSLSARQHGTDAGDQSKSFDLDSTILSSHDETEEHRLKSDSFSSSTFNAPTTAGNAAGSAEPFQNSSPQSFLELHASDVEIEPEPPAWQQRLQNPAILERLVVRERKRQDVINELIHTERTHVRNLKVLYQNFSRPMLTQRWLPPHILDLIFANLEEIIEVHSALSSALKVRQKSSAMVGSISDVLLSKFDEEEGQRLRIAAGTYCQNQAIGLDILRRRQKRDERLAKFLMDAEANPLCRRLQLRDMIPGEMQRLTRYPLLIEQLIKHTDSTALSSSDSFELVDLQRALRCAQEVVAYVNQAAEEASNRHRLAEVQRHMSTAPFDSINLPTTRHFHALNLTEHRLRFEGELLWHVPSAANTTTQQQQKGASSALPFSSSATSSANNNNNAVMLGQHYNNKYKAVPIRALLLDDILVLLSVDEHHHHQGQHNAPRRLILRYPNAPSRVNANQHALLDVDKIVSPVVRLDMVRIITPSSSSTAAAATATAGFEKRFHFLYKVPSPDGNIKNSKVQFYKFEAPSVAVRKSWLEQLHSAVESYTNANQYENILSHMPARARVSVTRPSERKRSRHELLLSINEVATPIIVGPLRQSSGSAPPPPVKKSDVTASPVISLTDHVPPRFHAFEDGDLTANKTAVQPYGHANDTHSPILSSDNISPVNLTVSFKLGDDAGGGNAAESDSIRTVATTTTSGSDDFADDETTAARAVASRGGGGDTGGYDVEDDIAFLDDDTSKHLIGPESVSIVLPPPCECAQHIVVTIQKPTPAPVAPLSAAKDDTTPDAATLSTPNKQSRPSQLAILQHLDALNHASTRQLRQAIKQSERLKHLIVTTTTAGASVCIVNSPPIIVADARRRRRSSAMVPSESLRQRASSAPPDDLPPLFQKPPSDAEKTTLGHHQQHRPSLAPTSPAPFFDPSLKVLGGGRFAPPPATLDELLGITQSLNDQLKALMTLSTERDAQVQHLRQQCNSMRGSVSFPQVFGELSPATLATYCEQQSDVHSNRHGQQLITASASASDRVRVTAGLHCDRNHKNVNDDDDNSSFIKQRSFNSGNNNNNNNEQLSRRFSL